MLLKLAITTLVFGFFLSLGSALCELAVAGLGFEGRLFTVFSLALVACLLVMAPEWPLRIAVIILSRITPQHDAASLERVLRDMQVLAARELQDDPTLAHSEIDFDAWSWHGPHPLKRPKLTLRLSLTRQIATRDEHARLSNVRDRLIPVLNAALAGKDLQRLHLASIRADPDNGILCIGRPGEHNRFPLCRTFHADVSSHEILAVTARYESPEAAGNRSSSGHRGTASADQAARDVHPILKVFRDWVRKRTVGLHAGPPDPDRG